MIGQVVEWNIVITRRHVQNRSTPLEQGFVKMSRGCPKAYEWLTEYCRHDRIQHRHPHCVRNVPSSGISAILSDGSSDTTDTLHVRHSHQSLGRWRVWSHAHNSCRLGQRQQQWQPIDPTTSLFLSFTFSVTFLLWRNKLNIVSDDINQLFVLLTALHSRINVNVIL